MGRKQDFEKIKQQIISKLDDGNILLIGAGDVNFKQKTKDITNTEHGYVGKYDQFQQFLQEDDFWRELERPSNFRATYKHHYIKDHSILMVELTEYGIVLCVLLIFFVGFYR